jgi:hypothetical protein
VSTLYLTGGGAFANIYGREIDEPGAGKDHDSSTGGLLGAFKKYGGF